MMEKLRDVIVYFYQQGMSDLLSPLLVTMADEPHAYVTFCAVMQRLKSNFFIDGVSMTKKFQHLTDGLLYYDPEFYAFLKLNQADDLLFCYRWLLLEMKREFNFDDSFKVLEVLWSSLPPNYPDKKTGGLPLFEVKFSLKIDETSSKPPAQREAELDTPSKRLTAYTKVACLRRQVSSSSSECTQKRFDRLIGKKIGQKPRIRSMGSASSFEDNKLVKSRSTMSETSPGHRKITDLRDFSKLTKRNRPKSSSKSTNSTGEVPADSEDDEIFQSVDDSPVVNVDEGEVVGYSHFNLVSATVSSPQDKSLALVCEKLPEPTEFGDGNPFLIFLSIACLLQHRNHIMKQGYDYQEIAMYFDRMVRKHDVEKTLSIARKLFAEYLNDDWSPGSTATTPQPNENGQMSNACV